MTKAEWEQVNDQYIALLKKENRTQLEELRYLYLDKIITYVTLTHEARNMGNKRPCDNFIIKNAKQKMEVAEARLREYINSHKRQTIEANYE